MGFVHADLGLEFWHCSLLLCHPGQVTCSETPFSHLQSDDRNIYFKRVVESYWLNKMIHIKTYSMDGATFNMESWKIYLLCLTSF